jgi:hypothetical protein
MKTKQVVQLRQSIRDALLAPPPEGIDNIILGKDPNRSLEHDGRASFYDFHGVTYGDDAEEQKVIDTCIAEVISERVGHPVTIVDQIDGNGRCTWWFKRLS